MKTLVLDVETTGIPMKGTSYEKDFSLYPYIVTIAWKVNEEPTRYLVINQEGRTIPEAAIAVHGITDEQAALSTIKIQDAIAIILNEVKDCEVVIGHNVHFDTGIIKANILRCISEGSADEAMYKSFEELVLKEKRVCTMRAAQNLCGGKWPKLVDLHLKLFGDTFEAHNSAYDVDATYRCYQELKSLNVI